MLEFAERVLREIRKLETDTEALVLNGNVSNMERYRFLMGRLEGIHLIDEVIRNEVKKYSDD
mgnify:FL=1|jgi:hypothetical protein